MSLGTGATSSAELLMASQGLSVGADLAGGISQSGALKAQGYADRAFGNVNADRLNAQADDAVARGATEANRAQMRADRLASEQRAGAMGGGADEIAAETRGLGAADAATISNNALREAFGFKSAASSERYRGNQGYKANKNAAGRTLVTGGLTAARDVAQGQYLYSRGQKDY